MSEPTAASAPDFPIDAALPALREALARHARVVLQAEPGAGKSTRVPLALLGEPWLKGKRLLLLEPRRLAARAVAQRMAQTRGEALGRTVGLRTRLETRISRETRIEVVTEGVLTRMLQSDPALEGTALVIFDEFHERSLQADVGLAFTLDAQATIAPQLKLLVMSATLDARALAQWLGEAAALNVPGRAYPVQTHFVGAGPPALMGRDAVTPGPTRQAIAGLAPGRVAERRLAQQVQHALEEQPGDVLVFLPGAGEIRRVQELLAEAGLPSQVSVHPLHGELALGEQDAALAVSPPGRRKVILATNIAETSLTVQGVRAVVDSGLARRSLFDPVTGMSRLVTRRIARDSAEQRQGRAGRLAPGVCYRLWSEEAHRMLLATTPAEILEADLVPLALELAAWGVPDASALRWLDAPPAAVLASARELLTRLGALDEAGRIGEHGRAMARLGVHPRLAHMLLRAGKLGLTPLAAQLAGLLSERDLLARSPPAADRSHGREARDADLRTRLEMLEGGSRADPALLGRIRRTAEQLTRQLGAPSDRVPSAPVAQALQPGLLLAFAYPDRIGLRREGGAGRYLLANGRGACFAEAQSLAREELIVAVDLADEEREARILLAAPLTRALLVQHFGDELSRAASVEWSEREAAVVARETVRFHALVIEERPLESPATEAVLGALLEGVRRLGIERLPWTREARELQARIQFLSALPELHGDWPAVDDAALAARLADWLGPWLGGMTRAQHLAALPLAQTLRALLSASQQRELEVLAPSHLTVPSGTRVRIDYCDENAPVVAVRLQEVFGLTQTPRIAGGRVPITFKLLSPAQRPVQITRDLASFWRGAYAEVRKDLRGRYPKHHWPENPLEAQPTRRAKASTRTTPRN